MAARIPRSRAADDTNCTACTGGSVHEAVHDHRSERMTPTTERYHAQCEIRLIWRTSPPSGLGRCDAQIRSLCGPGFVQLEGVALLLIIKLFHEFKEQVLQFCQTLAAPLLQMLKIIFERLEPFLHGSALIDE